MANPFLCMVENDHCALSCGYSQRRGPRQASWPLRALAVRATALITSYLLPYSMLVPLHSLPVKPAATGLIPVSLAAIDAALLARVLLEPHPQLLIDCQAQPCRRNVGVCYFLSQLLLLRQRGASVWLSNADAQLRGHIRQLGLESCFFIVD